MTQQKNEKTIQLDNYPLTEKQKEDLLALIAASNEISFMAGWRKGWENAIEDTLPF